MALLTGAGSELYFGEIPEGSNLQRLNSLSEFHKWIYQVNTSNFSLNSPTLDSNRISSSADRTQGAPGLVDQSGDISLNVPLCSYAFFIRHLVGDSDPRIISGAVSQPIEASGTAVTYYRKPDPATTQVKYLGLDPVEESTLTLIISGGTGTGNVTIVGTDAAGASS